MALYLISYEIAEKDGFEYEPLWTRLKALGAAKILHSGWALADNIGKASDIYAEIAPLIQEKDRLLVQEVTRDARYDKLLIGDANFEKLRERARR